MTTLLKATRQHCRVHRVALGFWHEFLAVIEQMTYNNTLSMVCKHFCNDNYCEDKQQANYYNYVLSQWTSSISCKGLGGNDC